MEARADSGERIPFVIERGAGRVLVDGQAVPLPPKEFRLLLELAQAPGEARSAPDLVEAVWGQDSGMSGNDVYWLVWKLRQRIGDDVRRRKILANRKGHGYLIDLAVADLAVVDVLPGESAPEDSAPSSEPPSAGGPERGRAEFASAGIGLGGEAGAFDPVARVAAAGTGTVQTPDRGDGSSEDLGSSKLRARANARTEARRIAMGRWLVAASVVVAAGVAGAVVRSIANDRATSPSERGRTAVETAEPEQPDAQEPRTRGSAEPHRDEKPRKRRGSPKGSARVAAAALARTAPSDDSGTEEYVETRPRPEGKREPKPQAPDLPAPPTRYLYHLYNSENGDHFVTTDGAAVTEHEAKGYEGAAVGRVYVTQESATKAIVLNKGSAFVFADASPQTDPASATLPLWLAKSEGDFFYTTSKSEASQDGWTATLIGYVRTL